jgi:hypothetical protein
LSSDPLRAWAAEQLPQLLAEARAEALVEARARLRERLVAALLDAAASPPRAAPAPAKTSDGPTTATFVPSGTTQPAGASSPTGRWVYGVVPADADIPTDWRGVDGEHAVELVREGELAALTSDVPLDTFGEEALQADLEDLARLEALARAHERVVDDALAAAGVVVPFRLCTIYESAGHVRDMLRRERDSLSSSVARLRGAAEWSVKAYAPERDDEETSDAPASGVAYLARKRDAREAADAAWQATEAAAERIHARLSEQAADAALGRPHDRRLSGHDGEMVMNAAYLVPDDRFERFRATVEELQHAGELELELSGPWPAYHFVAEEP